MAKTTVDTLAADVMAILEEYTGDVERLNTETVKEIGKKGVQSLKSASGVFGGRGKYASGWAVQTEETARTVSKATLYNGKLPGLPHLLEHGHAKRGGGRTAGKVHIQPVEEELIRAFEETLGRKL